MKKIITVVAICLLALGLKAQTSPWPPQRSTPEYFPALRIADSLALDSLAKTKFVQEYRDSFGGGSAAASWGNITGTLNSQTDLQNALNTKQPTLISGTNVRTINGVTLLGGGNIEISGGGTGNVNFIFQDLPTLLANSTFTLDSFAYCYTLKEGYTYQTLESGGDLQTSGGLQLLATPNMEGVITASQLNWSNKKWVDFEADIERRNKPFSLYIDTIYTVDTLGGDGITIAANSTIYANSREGGFQFLSTANAPTYYFLPDSNVTVKNLVFKDTARPTTQKDSRLFKLQNGQKYLNNYFDCPVSSIVAGVDVKNIEIMYNESHNGRWRIYIGSGAASNSGKTSTRRNFSENINVSFNSFYRGSIKNDEYIKMGGSFCKINDNYAEQASRDFLDTRAGLQDSEVMRNTIRSCGWATGFGGMQIKMGFFSTPPEKAIISRRNKIHFNTIINSTIEIQSNFDWLDWEANQGDLDTMGMSGMSVIGNTFRVDLNDSVIDSDGEKLLTQTKFNLVNATNLYSSGNQFFGTSNFVAGNIIVNTLVFCQNCTFDNITHISDGSKNFVNVLQLFDNCSFNFANLTIKKGVETSGSISVVNCRNLHFSGNITDSAGLGRIFNVTPNNRFTGENIISFQNLNAVGSDKTKPFIQLLNSDSLGFPSVRVTDCNVSGFKNTLELNGPQKFKNPLLFSGNTGYKMPLILMNNNLATRFTITNNSGQGGGSLFESVIPDNAIDSIITANNGGFGIYQKIASNSANYSGDYYQIYLPETGTTDNLTSLNGGTIGEKVKITTKAGNTINVGNAGNINVPSTREVTTGSSLILEFRPTKKWEELSYTP